MGDLPVGLESEAEVSGGLLQPAEESLRLGETVKGLF